MCELDSGVSNSIVNQICARDLQVEVEPYHGELVSYTGKVIEPLGRVTFDWSVRGRDKMYTTAFLVLNDENLPGFDAALAKDTTSSIGFYDINDTVW